MPLVTGRKTSKQPPVTPLGSQTGARKLPCPQLRESPRGGSGPCTLFWGGPSLEKQEGDPAVFSVIPRPDWATGTKTPDAHGGVLGAE